MIFIDATHFSVREEGKVSKKVAYVILGVRMDGKKEVLSIEIGENESSKYWYGVLNTLKALDEVKEKWDKLLLLQYLEGIELKIKK